MTGYGKAQGLVGKITLQIEVRCLNSKQFDINVKLPIQFREKEADIRGEAGRFLERGKIDIQVHILQDQSETSGKFNVQIAKQYYKALKNLSDELGEQPADLFSILMRIPEVTAQGENKLSDEDFIAFKTILAKSLQAADEFRQSEGESLKVDLLNRVSQMEKLAETLIEYEEERTISVKNRLKQKLIDWVGSDKIDENRLEQELIYYIEKFDISEEKTRLSQHCKYFGTTLAEPENSGKKLAFIAQEMGREINTIGSKANHVEIQKIVVLMKDELEKVKEQLNNVL